MLSSVMAPMSLGVELILCLFAAAVAGKIAFGLNAKGTPLANISNSDLLQADLPGPLIRGQERGRRLCEWASACSDVGSIYWVDAALLGLLFVPDLPLRFRQILATAVLVSLFVVAGRFMIAWCRNHQSRKVEQAIADNFRRRARAFDAF